MGSAVYNELWKANVNIMCSGGTGGEGMGFRGGGLWVHGCSTFSLI